MAKKTKAELSKQAKDRSIELVSLIQQGFHKQKLLEYCLLEFGVAQRTAERYILVAYETLKIEANKEKAHAFAVHLGRYEKIYKTSRDKFIEIAKSEDEEEDDEEVKWNPSWKALANLQMTMIQALKYREDLIGLHDKKLNIQINNNVAKIYDKKTAKSATSFDTSKLTFKEKLELRELLEESRLSTIEGVFPVILVDHSKYTEEVDAEFTLVKDNKGGEPLPEDVISKMKDISVPEKKVTVIPKLTIQDVKNKLEKTQNEEFLLLLKAAKEEKG